MNDIYFWGACGVLVYLVAVYALIALIAGPGAFICDECVDLCASIVMEKRAELIAARTITDFDAPPLSPALESSPMPVPSP